MFNKRLHAALNLLNEKGVKKYISSPLLYRGLWKLGIKIPPPLFSTFWNNFLVDAIFMSVFWGIWMTIIVWDSGVGPIAKILSIIFVGIFIGYYKASLTKKLQREHHLPTWEDLQLPSETSP